MSVDLVAGFGDQLKLGIPRPNQKAYCFDLLLCILEFVGRTTIANLLQVYISFDK